VIIRREGSWLTATTLASQLGMVVLGAAFTALCAQASIPWTPVPFTLQTLAVTLCGLSLGARVGLLSQVLYVLAGCAGLPVFAEASGGIATLFGPTGGYLVSFILTAGALGHAADRGWATKAWDLALALVVANLFILSLGATWLGFYIPTDQAFEAGFLPFLSGALLKSVVVWVTLPAARKLTRPQDPA
jgi:biotin transport system substrate-specific component